MIPTQYSNSQLVSNVASNIDCASGAQEAHHTRRLAAIVEVLGTAPRTSFEVASMLRWTRRQRPLRELGGPHPFLAFAETVAHLEHLATGRRIERVRLGGGGIGWSLDLA